MKNVKLKSPPQAPKPAKATTRRTGPRSAYRRAEVEEIFRRFSVQRPEPKGELEHVNPFTLVVAVALSAQATDAGVNKATRQLFAVADTPEKLLFGMAFQDALPPNGGMIYIFESTGPHRVTTKEYRFPVDMIWVDESRHILSVDENVPPCKLETCPWHGSTSPSVRYLIQTIAGFVKEAGVEVGGELKYTLRM